MAWLLTSMCAYLATGLDELFTWGANSTFTLGHENMQSRKLPEQVESFRRHAISIKKVSCFMLFIYLNFLIVVLYKWFNTLPVKYFCFGSTIEIKQNKFEKMGYMNVQIHLCTYVHAYRLKRKYCTYCMYTLAHIYWNHVELCVSIRKFYFLMTLMILLPSIHSFLGYYLPSVFLHQLLAATLWNDQCLNILSQHLYPPHWLCSGLTAKCLDNRLNYKAWYYDWM